MRRNTEHTLSTCAHTHTQWQHGRDVNGRALGPMATSNRTATAPAATPTSPWPRHRALHKALSERSMATSPTAIPGGRWETAPGIARVTTFATMASHVCTNRRPSILSKHNERWGATMPCQQARDHKRGIDAARHAMQVAPGMCQRLSCACARTLSRRDRGRSRMGTPTKSG